MDRSGKSNSKRFPHRKRRGKHVCRYCGKTLGGLKRSFCSKHCLRDFFMRTDWQRVRLVVYERDGHYCMKCNKYLMRNEFTVDHIMPVSKGGSEWHLENLQLMCEKCNKSKSAKYSKKMGGVSEQQYKREERNRKLRIRRKK